MSFKSYAQVFKNSDFTKLWISQAASQLTNYILSFAILIKVFQLTNSSASVALIIMAFGVGTVFFGSIAGVFADRFDRKWVLTIVNFLQAGSIALYFLVGGEFWGLLLITFLYSSLNQFYISAEVPSIPNLVPKDQILIANSCFAITNSAALIIGFASAGPLSLVLGKTAPYFAGVILLFISGLATLALPALKPQEPKDKFFALSLVWHEFKEGIMHFWENKKLHFPLLSLLAVQVVNGMLITLAPAFMQKTIGINLQTGSLLVVGPLGIGILIGASILGFEEKYFSKQQLVLTGIIGMGALVASLSLINYFHHDDKYVYYSVVAVIIGYFNAHIFAPSHSILQTYTLTHIRGRIYGSLYVLLQIVATLPTIIIGVLADKVTLTHVIAGLGLLLVSFGWVLRTKLDNFS